PFDFKGTGSQPAGPEAVNTPPGRNPFAFGGDDPAPGARTLQGAAQRRAGTMPIVPNYADDSGLAARKGKAPVAVDVKGGKAVAKGKQKKRHMATSPSPKATKR
ncbi:MAG: hypothetical protein FJZ00_13830, partial [Candidatus Sericytochromatia bacterium]|nr:hypothetical protein [Candidatus Tanganyikabacteria bacterium]